MNLDKLIIKISGIFSLIAILAFGFFQYSTKVVNDDLSLLSQPQVAGIETTKNVPTDITKDLPIPKEAKLSSIDKLTNEGIEKLIITVEVSNGITNIPDLYKSTLYSNGWEEVAQNIYAKGNKQLQLDITGQIVTLTIIDNNGK